MKLYATIELNRTDVDAPKGEALDDAVRSALEMVEVDGYDTMGAVVTRESPLKAASDDAKSIQQNIENMLSMGLRIGAVWEDTPEGKDKLITMLIDVLSVGRRYYEKTDRAKSEEFWNARREFLGRLEK
jgi:hypothetical protein